MDDEEGEAGETEEGKGGDEDGEQTLEYDIGEGVVLDEKENVGSAIKPCFIIVDTSLDAIVTYRSKKRKKSVRGILWNQEDRNGYFAK